jgi:hypothetical protein
MDNGLLFPYRYCGGKGGTRKGKLSIPIGHGVSSTIGDAGAGKSTPDVIAEGGRKLRGNPIRFSRAYAVQKSLVAFEAVAPVPQTDSGRWG